jgi:cytochrome b561
MTRRRLVIAAHWSTAFLLAVLLIEGPGAATWLVWLFAGIALVWVASYILGRGPMTRPGPKLEGWLRPIHRAQHHALYIALAALTFFVLTDLQSTATGRALKVLLFLGLLHGAFHLWRHTALFDGALRAITPSALHRLL